MVREIFMTEMYRHLESMSMSTDPIDIDVLICDKTDPPFNNLDFQCNGLIMNKHGIGLCTQLKRSLNSIGIVRKLDTITTDIRNNRAVLVSLKSGRWDKMASKGWDIVGGVVEKVKKDGERCTLCLDDLQPEEVYKFNCCNASYHRPCMGKIISSGNTAIADTGKCPHCRQWIGMFSEEIPVFGEV
jgi:hypothetical protein